MKIFKMKLLLSQVKQIKLYLSLDILTLTFYIYQIDLLRISIMIPGKLRPIFNTKNLSSFNTNMMGIKTRLKQNLF